MHDMLQLDFIIHSFASRILIWAVRATACPKGLEVGKADQIADRHDDQYA